jgi:hypothetical protein
MTVATNNLPQGTVEAEFEDDKGDCCTEESIARDDKPIVEAEFEGDKDDFIEFFLRPYGRQLDEDDCRVAEDEYRRRIHRTG